MLNEKLNEVYVERHDGEKYVVRFDDESAPEALKTLGRLAKDPNLSFTWADAAYLSKEIRQVVARKELDEKLRLNPIWPETIQQRLSGYF